MKWNEVIYGPVKSRRLGQSLGINLTPLEVKVCNFNCGYCRVGINSKGEANKETFEKYGWTLPNVKEAIIKGFGFHIKNQTKMDYITICGNSEPTLYSWFPEIVEFLEREKSYFFPKTPRAIFSNATTLDNEVVRESMKKFERVFLKIDAGDEPTFKRINSPIGICYGQVIDNLISYKGGELSIAITGGEISNYSSFFNETFIENLKKTEFKKIFLYDIDIPRTTSQKFSEKLKQEPLINLANYFGKALNKKVGEEIVILWEPKTRSENLSLYPKQTN